MTEIANFRAPPVAGRRNPAELNKTLIANVRNDITIPFFNDVMRPTDSTLLARGGGRGLGLYDEIERDTHAYAVLMKRKLELVERDWEMNPASEAPLDKEAAEFCAEEIERLPFDRICLGLLDATLKGFSVGETVWERRGNHIVPARVKIHDQRRFVFDPDWNLRLLTREAILNGVALPPRKFMVHRFDAETSDPYGLGLGTRLFWAVLFKREGAAFWLKYLDKYASPTPVGKTPIGLPEPEQQKILRALENLAQGLGITVPIGTELDFLEATRAGPASYEAWCRYWDEQISETVLGETLSTNIGKLGSQAAATVHADGKSQIVTADADLLSDTIQETLLAWMVEYNFPGAGTPRLERKRPKNEKAEAEAREQIAKADEAERKTFEGALRLIEGLEEPAAVTAIRMMSSLAARLEDEQLKAIIKKGPPKPPALGEGAPRETQASPKPKPALDDDEESDPAFSLSAAAFAASDHLPDALYEACRDALAGAIESWMNSARSRVAKAGELEDFVNIPLNLALDLPVTDLAAPLSKGLVLAELVGRNAIIEEARSEGVSFADDDIVWDGAPFAEAIEFLRQKTALPQNDWRELSARGHDRAFVVAGATRVELAADLQGMVIRNLEKGGLAGFRNEFDALLAAGKWTGDADLLDPAKTRKRAWRTETIFMTNLRNAHAAGRRKQQLQMKDVLPFGQYRHAATRTPKRPRVRHVALDGLTLPIDHEVWDRIYAPNGWMCSCAIRTITAEAAGAVAEEHRDPPTEAQIAEAIPLEWQHAPGLTWERGLVPKEDAGLLDVSGTRRAAARSVALPPLADIAVPFPELPAIDSSQSDEALAGQFLARFGASATRAALWTDLAGQRLVISRHLFENAAGELKLRKRGRETELLRLAETLADPDEIWVDWEASRTGGVPRLVRTYLRYDPAVALVSIFRWSEEGWIGVTTHPKTTKSRKASANALERQRHGALLYRREKE